MIAATLKPAFKYEYGPASLTREEPVGMKPSRRFRRYSLGIVLIAHALVLFLNPTWFFSPPEFNMEESSVDVDFVGDLTLKAPQETALPNSKPADEAKVPANLLPQLPKKFEVEEAKPVEKSVAEEKDPKAEEALAKKEVAPPEKLETPKTQDDPNKVSREDLMKRLAVEKLKRENKIDQQMKAQKNALAKLKEDLLAAQANQNSGGAGSAAGSLRAKTYADLLRAAVKRNLFLPKTFEYDQAQLVTQLSVVINQKGELVEVKLSRSSGNGAYDQAAISAIQNSVPLPQPPAEIAGQVITFNLSK
jgi:colicin import membrane protein